MSRDKESYINHVLRFLPLETVSQLPLQSFRAEARNLGFNDFNNLRFLTFVRNDTFPNYGTVSWSK